MQLAIPTSSLFRALALLGLLASLGAGSAWGTPTPIGSPSFRYRFITYRLIGGGLYDPDTLDEVNQTGGIIYDFLEVGEFQDGVPEMEVFSNEGATTFWVAADAPHTLPDPVAGEPVGSNALLTISQTFRKDELDASFSFTITAAKLIGLDSSPAGDQRSVTALLLVEVDARDQLGFSFFHFFDLPVLTGLGRANGGPGPCNPPCWDFGSEGHLPMAVTAGGLDQGYVEVTLTAPFKQSLDLSTIPVGEQFTVTYQAMADAVDTAQVDTGGTAIFRDPTDPNSGAYFEYTGLTPTEPVPEPAAPLLLLAGLGVLLSARAARRARCRAALAGLLLLAPAVGARADIFGPSQYLCFDATATGATGSCGTKDSPFKAIGTGYFYLEDFEDDAFEPGWSIGGMQTRNGPSPTTDSVDEDDGAIDGSGVAGSSHLEAGAFTIDFDENVLGAFPTHVGLVWTDGGSGVLVTFEAFSASGSSLGSLSSPAGDPADDGATVEDVFFGWSEPTGISAVRVSQASGSPEIDHLQYGGPQPEGLDAFLCYKVKPSKGSDDFEKRSVSLANLFETGSADVVKYAALCNPANLNGQGIADPVTHLASFKIKPDAKHVKQSGPVATSFGELVLETRTPDRLLVPSSKSLVGPVEPPAAPSVDHFECYPVKTPKGEEKFAAVEVELADQFTAAHTFDVKKATRLCVAVDKNGEGIPDPGAALLCYEVKSGKFEPKHEKREGVYVANQFGAGQLDTVKEEELCVPASFGNPKLR